MIFRSQKSPFLFLLLTIALVINILVFIFFPVPNNGSNWLIPLQKFWLKSYKPPKQFRSYCSLEADNPHQNVIAYSLYGDFSDAKILARYVDPFLRNTIANISSAYPGKRLLHIKYN